jgi:hypothetical protein
MRALVNAATNSLIALRTLVSAGIHRYAERPQLRSTLSTVADHLADECRASPDGGHCQVQRNG